MNFTGFVLQSNAGAVALQELLLDELVARSATGMLQEGRKTLLYKDVGECPPFALHQAQSQRAGELAEGYIAEAQQCQGSGLCTITPHKGLAWFADKKCTKVEHHATAAFQQQVTRSFEAIIKSSCHFWAL